MKPDADIMLHSSRDGPWLKRLRISLFGLTARERAHNSRAFAALQQRARESNQAEEAQDEALLLRLEIAEFTTVHGRRPARVRMSHSEIRLLRVHPAPSPFAVSAEGASFDGIPVVVDHERIRDYILDLE